MKVSPTEGNMSAAVNIPKDQRAIAQDSEQPCGGPLECIIKVLCLMIMVVTFPVSINAFKNQPKTSFSKSF